MVVIYWHLVYFVDWNQTEHYPVQESTSKEEHGYRRSNSAVVLNNLLEFYTNKISALLERQKRIEKAAETLPRDMGASKKFLTDLRCPHKNNLFLKATFFSFHSILFLVNHSQYLLFKCRHWQYEIREDARETIQECQRSGFQNTCQLRRVAKKPGFE